jgi:hypothetical protein
VLLFAGRMLCCCLCAAAVLLFAGLMLCCFLLGSCERVEMRSLLLLYRPIQIAAKGRHPLHLGTRWIVQPILQPPQRPREARAPAAGAMVAVTDRMTMQTRRRRHLDRQPHRPPQPRTANRRRIRVLWETPSSLMWKTPSDNLITEGDDRRDWGINY